MKTFIITFNALTLVTKTLPLSVHTNIVNAISLFSSHTFLFHFFLTQNTTTLVITFKGNSLHGSLALFLPSLKKLSISVCIRSYLKQLSLSRALISFY